MRILTIVLLLVLTPLRGWAADSMAVQMATQGLGDHTNVQASEARGVDPAIHCAGMADHHADAAAPADDEDATGSADHCNNCAACQVCATVALIAPSFAGATNPQVHRLPWASVSAFSNAELATDKKPPIS